MQKRTTKVALLAVLTIILVLSFTGVALADQTWSDLPDSVTAKYGITDNQVAQISDGYANGMWKPYQAVTRAQFTKMAVAAFGVNLVNPATPSFTDVPKSNIYYQAIEGAKAAGVINGTTATTFSPNANITRQQAIAIVSRYVAMANGYDLTAMSSAEIAALLAHFGDAASVSESLKAEVAFAYDFNITLGDAYGNVNPLANMTRIQGAAFLIRAQALIPPANWTAAKIELVSADKSENLIGQFRQVTFKVTTAAGHPAKNVLVDFDTIFAGPWYVGNISAEAAMTDSMGEVTINLLATEPGTQRVSAAVSGVAAVYTTAYWLALDAVYTIGDDEAENNAGDAHTWAARAVVFGPGPFSTSQNDWYNWVDPDNASNEDKGINEGGWFSFDREEDFADDGYAPRTMAGIDMHWSIVNVENDDPTTISTDDTVPSVGMITAVDGVAITPALAAKGMTDANGLSTIEVYSEQTGWTYTQVIADYAGNPYPQQLLDHDTVEDFDIDDDWDDQPDGGAYQYKYWIPHVIGGDDDSPITPVYAVNNVGEVEQFVLTLEDVYGNPIEDYMVEWWIQGVGFFKTDDSSWTGIGEQNKDLDWTDDAGQASVWVKSTEPGQTIVHCKVMDKYGLPWKEWNAVKQWYQIDEVWFTDYQVWTDEDDDGIVDEGEWDTPVNVVDTEHTFHVKVAGAKYVYTLYDLNGNGFRDDKVLIGDRADIADSSGYVAYIENNTLKWASVSDYDIKPGEVFTQNRQGGPYYTRFADIALEDNEFWSDDAENDAEAGGFINVGDDGIAEVWAGLSGKGVNFFTNIGDGGAPVSNTPLPIYVPGAPDDPEYVGSIVDAGTPWTPVVYGGETFVYDAVTDAMGEAWVTIKSLDKGWQYVYAVADYPANIQSGNPDMPLDWNQLEWDWADKLWIADYTDFGVKIFAASDDPFRVGLEWTNPVYDWARGETAVESPNTEIIAVQMFDAYGNSLAGFKVTWEIVSQGVATGSTVKTYHPFAHFEDVDWGPGDGIGDLNTDTNINPYWGNFGSYAGPDLDENENDTADADYAWGYTRNGEIDNELTLESAAHVTLVLDEMPDDWDDEYDSVSSIVNIKLFAPVTGAFIDDWEVTKRWEAPRPTTIAISPASAVNPEGVDHTVTALVKDQFGQPMEGLDVYFEGDVSEGGSAYDTYLDDGWISFGSAVVTDADGKAVAVDAAVAWSAWNIRAWVDWDEDGSLDTGELVSSTVTKYWAMEDSMVFDDNGYLLEINSGLGSYLNGKAFNVRIDSPTGTVIGSGVYNNAAGNSVTMSVQLEEGDRVWIQFIGSALDDGDPNWVFGDVAEIPIG